MVNVAARRADDFRAGTEIRHPEAPQHEGEPVHPGAPLAMLCPLRVATVIGHSMHIALINWKQADKPDSVTALACYGGHSSGTRITARLKPPTRRLRGTTSAPAYLVLLRVEIARFTQT